MRVECQFKTGQVAKLVEKKLEQIGLEVGIDRDKINRFRNVGLIPRHCWQWGGRRYKIGWKYAEYSEETVAWVLFAQQLLLSYKYVTEGKVAMIFRVATHTWESSYSTLAKLTAYFDEANHHYPLFVRSLLNAGLDLPDEVTSDAAPDPNVG
jgi:hypothetical protein